MAKLKVLIVDDEVFFRSIVGEWFKSWGHEVVMASGGLEAVSAVNNNKFDLIILDYIMPEMDGVVTLKEIRKINPDVPVIMFTGHPTGESIEGTSHLGISAYVTKMGVANDIQESLRTIVFLLEKKVKAGKTNS